MGLGGAAALGALQGPTELLPISSSAHTILIPALLRWPYASADPELRKSFEVALHLGSAAALVARPRWPLKTHALTLAPAAIAGLVFERPVERRLSSVRAVALAQIVAGAALVVADSRPGERSFRDLTLADSAWLGAAQGVALVPGVSRAGATLTTARLLGFDAAAAQAFAREAALPVLVAAAALKAIRIRPTRAHATGAATAFLSTLAARPLARRVHRYRLLGAYRILLGALALKAGCC